MYSYQDRLRAVQLYSRLGKRVRATIRQLEYPTRNSLATWYREFCSQGDLQVCVVRRPPKYSDEQKRVAVEHYLNHGRCVSPTMKALFYPGRATMTAWAHELFPGAKNCAVGKLGGHPSLWQQSNLPSSSCVLVWSDLNLELKIALERL